MIEEFAKTNNLPKYRIDQFNQAYFHDLISNWNELTTWPKALRDKVASELKFFSITPVTKVTSENGHTTKVVFARNSDKKKFETVLMRHHHERNTICVSCMIGCPVGCSFCATGRLGFHGNLSAWEIIEQIMYFQRLLAGEDRKVTNIVFMGMGEPMLNFDEVMRSLDLITSKDKLSMSSRRITISTSGYANKLKVLIDKGFRGRIAISLHAPNQKLREIMMPVAKAFTLEKLFEVLDYYVELTNKRVSYEYILIDGVNDQEKHALQLTELLANRLAHVNLIPYNPISGVNFKCSNAQAINEFKQILEKFSIPVSIRKTMGDDVNAACGQLANV